MRGAGEFQPAADHRALQRGDHRHAAILNAVEHPVPHLRMPQAVGGVVLGQFRQIEAGGEMIADAVDHHGADVIREIGEAILDRQDDAVVQRVALGRAVEADGQHRARCLDLEQRGWAAVAAERRFPWIIIPVRIVIFYNYWGGVNMAGPARPLQERVRARLKVLRFLRRDATGHLSNGSVSRRSIPVFGVLLAGACRLCLAGETASSYCCEFSGILRY